VKRLRDLLDAWRSLGDRTRMTLGAVVILAVIGGLAGGAVAWGDWRDASFRHGCAARGGIVSDLLLTTYYAERPPTYNHGTYCLDPVTGDVLDTQ
jgi:hypothetical protein